MGTSPVADRRGQLDLTQAEAARQAGVSLATWRRFETEPDAQLSDASLRGIARALKVSKSTLMWMHEDPTLDVTQLGTVTHAHADEEWLARLNDSFTGDPLTPRQALAIEWAARQLSDEEGLVWEDLAAGRVRITQAAPFSMLPPGVLLATNDAWRSRFLDTFEELADRITEGHPPYPRCVAEEIALYLCIEEALGNPLDELYDDETLQQLDDYGAEEDLDVPLDTMFQDHDFKALWARDNWLESPTAAALLGVDPDTYHPHNWWQRFNNADDYDQVRAE